MRIATYNIHDCIGRDGKHNPERIIGVFAELEADLIAVQEVILDHDGELVTRLEQETGMFAVDGTLFDRGIGRYGNLILVKQALSRSTIHDLSVPGRERRGCVEITLDGGPIPELTVFATHLGLRRGERRRQVAELTTMTQGVDAPMVMLGDFNCWHTWPVLKPLTQLGFHQCSVRSFPAWPRPVVALDRILVSTVIGIECCWTHRTALSRAASDHLPVIAEIHAAQK
ncbi:MAG: endonuclease/exonuclease/phosphatase family protein [Gammaproteobacteria bacterium]|nr:endonuclease/exonuclease/phosphatase family protein [Gammaproteobacteria bacterium]